MNCSNLSMVKTVSLYNHIRRAKNINSVVSRCAINIEDVVSNDAIVDGGNIDSSSSASNAIVNDLNIRVRVVNAVIVCISDLVVKIYSYARKTRENIVSYSQRFNRNCSKCAFIIICNNSSIARCLTIVNCSACSPANIEENTINMFKSRSIAVNIDIISYKGNVLNSITPKSKGDG